MKIGLVIDHFDFRRGGSQWWTRLYAEHLLRQGHEVHVVAQDFHLQAARLPIIPHGLGRIRSPLGRAEAAADMLRTLRLDLIHDMGVGWRCDFLQPHAGCWTALRRQKLLLVPSWLRRIKRVVDPLLPRHREHEAVERRQSTAHPLLLAPSRKVADEFRREHDYPAQRIRVVYHGVDAERFSPEQCRRHRESVRRGLGLGNDQTVLLFVGHNFALKGLATLIRAVGQLAGEGGRFQAVVLGKGRTRPYRRLAQRCGAGRAVRFVGTSDDPLPYYAAADLCVQPTFYDSFGLSVLEAAACGLPVVTTQVAGVSELLSDGVNGYILSDPADDKVLAERVRPLGDPALRRAMGEAARRLAEQHDFARNCREIEAFYSESQPS